MGYDVIHFSETYPCKGTGANERVHVPRQRTHDSTSAEKKTGRDHGEFPA